MELFAQYKNVPGYHTSAKYSPESRPDVSVVIPAHNGRTALMATLDGLVPHLAQEFQYELVIVDDGSVSPLDDLADLYPHLSVLTGPNQGKGSALRAGLAFASGQALAFIDVDGDYGPKALVSMIKMVHSGATKCVIGQRYTYSSTKLRAAASKAFAWWVRAIHNMDFDTQAGIKVFDAGLVSSVLPILGATGFAIDVDILSAMRHLGFAPPVLYPVFLTTQTTSTVTMRRSSLALLEVLRVRRSSTSWIAQP